MAVRQFIQNRLDFQPFGLSTANEIEIKLDEEYPFDDFIQETIIMLASFRPGGGDYLYGEEEIRKRLKATVRYLEKLEK